VFLHKLIDSRLAGNFSPLTTKFYDVFIGSFHFLQISSLWIFETNFACVFHPAAWPTYVIFLDSIMLRVAVSSTNHEASHYVVFFSSWWFPHAEAQTSPSAAHSHTSLVSTHPFEWQTKFCSHTNRNENSKSIFSVFCFHISEGRTNVSETSCNKHSPNLMCS